MRSRANVSLLQSELANSAKAMETDKAANDRYAATPTAANDGKGLPIGKATNYQYRSTATTYCITATNGGVSYMISEVSTSPTAGGCPGDPANGEISNLVTNPSIESNMTGWGSTWVATPVARVSGGAGVVSGGSALEINAGTANASGGLYSFSNLQSGTAYMVSAYVTLVSGEGTPFMISANDGAGTRAWKSIAASLTVGQPVRVSLTWTSSATPNGNISFMRNGTATGTGAIRIDNLMITQGSSLYNYADGASPGWIWNGTAQNSTSKGLAL